MKNKLFILFFILTITLTGQNFTPEQAEVLCQPALKCIQKLYPYKPGKVLGSDADVVAPKVDHPAFYGCFDWHSSVHGHWTLVRLLKSYPGLPEAKQIRTMFEENLTSEHIQKEIAFFADPNNKTFERTYGWAWLLKLQMELRTWDDPLGKQLAANVQPLADTIVSKYSHFLDKLNYPIRVGEHTNTAFGLTFAWDYANAFGETVLKNKIEDKALQFYEKDKDCPISWEPGGFDFLSPCLIEADLMTRVMNKVDYMLWLQSFLPGLGDDEGIKLEPAVVSDRTDGKLVHLDGLNLSRAWCLFNIARKLPGEDEDIIAMAKQHLNAALPHVTSGAYEGEHWLASFAVYALMCE
ncbi:DUF2891 domain-containing protein [Saccharicrinis sp. FJH54]|uniref:DUF2891 domain-containing protein n=1 Tax=Saccharicrinis sp. FJH54 TaxID=3344665 RepID=UPI0035D507F2